MRRPAGQPVLGIHGVHAAARPAWITPAETARAKCHKNGQAIRFDLHQSNDVTIAVALLLVNTIFMGGSTRSVTRSMGSIFL